MANIHFSLWGALITHSVWEAILTKDSNELLAQNWGIRPGLGTNTSRKGHDWGGCTALWLLRPAAKARQAAYRLTLIQLGPGVLSEPCLALLCNFEGAGTLSVPLLEVVWCLPGTGAGCGGTERLQGWLRVAARELEHLLVLPISASKSLWESPKREP